MAYILKISLVQNTTVWLRCPHIPSLFPGSRVGVQALRFGQDTLLGQTATGIPDVAEAPLPIQETRLSSARVKRPVREELGDGDGGGAAVRMHAALSK